LQIGQAQIELTKPTVPCHQITASFSNGDCARIGQKTNRGWSRWYAQVLVEAQVGEGEGVEILPAPPNYLTQVAPYEARRFSRGQRRAKPACAGCRPDLIASTQRLGPALPARKPPGLIGCDLS